MADHRQVAVLIEVAPMLSGEEAGSPSPDLTVVVVNYNNRRVLEACLPSLMAALVGLRSEVILSDNGSTDGSLAWVAERFPTISILENNANLGFAEANNRAFARAAGRLILLLNPDTVVEPQAIRSMVEFLDEHPKAGAIGCKLLNADGSRQVSARRFPTLTTYALHFSGLAHRFPANRFFGQYAMTDWDGESARVVDWVCGAVILTRREIIERVGGLDPYFFLTYDEVDWCHRIKKAGYEVWYTPSAKITHLDRQSEPQANPNPQARIKYMTVERNSRVRYFAKHRVFGYALTVELLHVLCAVGLLMKAAVFGTNRSDVGLMETRLTLVLNWRTLCRLPRVWMDRLGRMWRRRSAHDSAPIPLFVNPYLAEKP